jgi:hypothetical protein
MYRVPSGAREGETVCVERSGGAFYTFLTGRKMPLDTGVNEDARFIVL